jgi:predicted  nucleic acid-binding Zn ribbon protein
MARYLSSQEVIHHDSNPAIDDVTEARAVTEGIGQLGEDRELSECPDCQGELTQYYDWDTVKYRCENCGILINNLGFLMEES